VKRLETSRFEKEEYVYPLRKSDEMCDGPREGPNKQLTDSPKGFVSGCLTTLFSKLVLLYISDIGNLWTWMESEFPR
jgi:hypothetical protein